VILTDGHHDVPPGKVASVVTYLEMTAPAAPRPVPEPRGIALERIERPETGWYRDLFARVGGHDWLWFSRLNMAEAELQAILHDPDVEVHALMAGPLAVGLLELDFRTPDECELAFFGVTRQLVGAGAGRFMMNAAIGLAWARPITRFHVHTCTLDAPTALPFYRRSGFVPTRQRIEVEPDPRLTGKLPLDAAPQVPIFRGAGSTP
jgi:GNAT superfamily N-acetyltransferase